MCSNGGSVWVQGAFRCADNISADVTFRALVSHPDAKPGRPPGTFDAMALQKRLPWLLVSVAPGAHMLMLTPASMAVPLSEQTATSV